MSQYLTGQRISPAPVHSQTSVTELVDSAFEAYNAARLREACHLFTKKMLGEDVTVGLSLSGALTPAGLGVSCLVPLVELGFVDWMVSTGANLYHDTHFALGCPLHHGTSRVDDERLRRQGVVRIYDIFFDYQVLLSTDEFYRQVVSAPEFQVEMGTAEFHHRVGRYVAERERLLESSGQSLLAAAYRFDTPIYAPSPGDSSIGMNLAARTLLGDKLRLDVTRDVNESAAIVLAAKRSGGKSAVFILGGGSPKNFLLQTEPQIQEVLGIDEKGHDFFLQVTDARPDTGGLSGATPSEAVSWGKVDPAHLPDAVVCYLDCTVAIPLITAYALANRVPREPKRLYRRLPQMVEALEREFHEALARGHPA
jgi:deoxyhypusine synthase